MNRLIKNRGWIATMSEPAENILWGDEVQSQGNHLLQSFTRACPQPSQAGFQLREGLFNGREIRRIRWQKYETTASGFNGLPHPWSLMDQEIVQDHDLPWAQAGGQDLLHVIGKSGAISRPVQQERRPHPRKRHRGDDGQDGSIIARHLAVSALPSWGVGIQGGHGNVGAGFIHKHQVSTCQLSRLLAPGGPFGFLLLAGSYGLVFRVQPRACLARVILAGLTSMPCASLKRRQCSSRRRSGWASN